MTRRSAFGTLLACLFGSAMVFAIATILSLKPLDQPLREYGGGTSLPRITDRSGIPLTASYQAPLNQNDRRALHEIPLRLQQAFILSEDRHFYGHHGMDWRARLAALWQNLRAGKSVRGASTITEQVVRIINPRPRTLWSRWLEGWEAALLERNNSKSDILECYLNQVPYAANRRGVAQAARYYFDRDVGTLSSQEMVTLAVLPRAPSAWDLHTHPGRVQRAAKQLATTMKDEGLLSPDEYQTILDDNLMLDLPASPVEASHFIRYLREQPYHLADGRNSLRTTLDADLQREVQLLLDARLGALTSKHVQNAAVLVADHQTGEILAWVIGGNGPLAHADTPAAKVDAVLTPRQPGSTLKPFLYAMSFDKGWGPATLLEDAPLASAVGNGLHHFNNYSQSFYGNISLREALGNSLNIPALHAIAFVGVDPFLTKLHQLGFASLTKADWFYDDGLALGNGEVTLLELTTAYAGLANKGRLRPLHAIASNDQPARTVQAFSPEAASLIGNILSDPWARRLEFGAGSVLNLPTQTAVKTGTSTDYRDAWAVGYNNRFVVGVWMGNLDQTPMHKITGSSGPALVLRSIFAELNQQHETAPLYLSPRLVQQDVCLPSPAGINQPSSHACFKRREYFMPAGLQPIAQANAAPVESTAILRPTEKLQLAYDPRIPATDQFFTFRLNKLPPGQSVEWHLNGIYLGRTERPDYSWPVKRGDFTVTAYILQPDGGPANALPPVHFSVK
ncbi:penicillin-binding protein 1C [bacterium]|nr:penicillin-binding protein 1C [bacterium]